ncbi:monooxygenase [Streptomyces sp. NPDC101116]|uniref:monooxygenase n=1 Tax=Streptomyces sp. NPDC101116 TaxID=3366107 RepID=UPI0037FFD20F
MPQDRHPHVLLEGGRQALERLLPGMEALLWAADSPRVGVPSDVLQWQEGSWSRRFPSTTYLYTGPRPVLEAIIRERVLRSPKIAVVRAKATGLLGDHQRLRGISVHRTDGSDTPTVLNADIIVDASGRHSKFPVWLEALGAEPPHEEWIDTGLGYASQLYRGDMTGLGDARGCYIMPDASQPRGAVILPQGRGTHLVCLLGLRGSEPPVDQVEFQEFLRLLPHPFLHDWLATAETASPVFGFRHTANVRRRYEWASVPAGLLTVGDALCSFNPVYGQGISAAALSALALRAVLEDGLTCSTHRLQQTVATAYEQPWRLSSAGDAGLPGATGDIPAPGLLDRCLGRYMRRIRRLAPHDPHVGSAFRAVLTLSKPLTSLLSPRVAVRIFLRSVPPALVEPPTAKSPMATLPRKTKRMREERPVKSTASRGDRITAHCGLVCVLIVSTMFAVIAGPPFGTVIAGLFAVLYLCALTFYSLRHRSIADGARRAYLFTFTWTNWF